MVQSTNTMASLVLSVFRNRTPPLMLTLFKTMVMSKLEYCCPVWNLHKIGGIESIESIQRNLGAAFMVTKAWTIGSAWRNYVPCPSNDDESDISLYTPENSQWWGVKWPKYVIVRNPDAWYKGNSPIHQQQGSAIRGNTLRNSFGVMAAKLWNISPAEINYKISFKIALAKFLKDFPETPPTDGYTSITNSTLL